MYRTLGELLSRESNKAPAAEKENSKKDPVLEEHASSAEEYERVFRATGYRDIRYREFMATAELANYLHKQPNEEFNNRPANK